MLLGPHFLVGAAIASNFQNPLAGFVIAFLSHFFLDRIPHWEYSIEPLKEIKTKGMGYAMPILRRVALDVLLGFIVLIIASILARRDISFIQAAVGGFFGILPDGLSMLLFLKRGKGIFASLLKIFYLFHQKAHYDKKANPPMRIGLSTQAIAILLAIYFLIF
ncbi:MAG: hypothetical protein HYS15_01005 [Candidatus Spechtbacteria bacterium]|nr:hypothetical protein [Candidatus Spechtbacteria bacterium]